MTELSDVAQMLVYRAKAVLPDAKFAAYTQEQINQIVHVLPLSHDLITWHTSNAPVQLEVPLTGNDFLLYAPEKLISYQYGYRWNGLTDTREPLEAWSAEWVVIGDVSVDPIIAHTDKAGTPISGALHGAGEWKPRLIAPNLVTFIQCVTVLVDTVERFSKEERFTDDLSLRPEVITFIRSHLEPLLSADLIDNFIWFRYG
jgi:hypothetical protein